MIVDAGGFANQQAVVLGQTRVILALNQFDVDAHALADPDEIRQCLGVGWRQSFLWIVQYRQVVTRHLRRARHSPDFTAETVQRIGELIFLIIAQLVQGAGLYTFDVPAVSSTKLN
ncbi:hypothetical protein D3C81_1949220 [compost metagenome]